MTDGVMDFLHGQLDVITHTFTLKGLLWIALTLVFYQASLRIHRLSGGSPFVHPLVLTAGFVGLALLASSTGIRDYQTHASLIHWLLGPATVSLALPMYAQWQRIRHHGWRLIAGIASGGVIAPLTAWLTLYVADGPLALKMTMLVKSITTPLAMEAGAQVGGVPALAAVFVITTGIVGAVVSALVFTLFRVSDPQAQGLALGTVAHAVGTAKALQMSEQTGAMATLGLCLNGIMTAVIVPLIFS